jgi:rhodanese-related sulfurtransferase
METPVFGSKTLKTFTPAQTQAEMAAGRITLVDVREPEEYAAEHIVGARLAPLSSLDPKALPHGQGLPIVLHCGSGKRSAVALEKCAKAGLPVEAHMAGGIAAWKAAGLPTARGRG